MNVPIKFIRTTLSEDTLLVIATEPQPESGARAGESGERAQVFDATHREPEFRGVPDSPLHE